VTPDSNARRPHLLHDLRDAEQRAVNRWAVLLGLAAYSPGALSCGDGNRSGEDARKVSTSSTSTTTTNRAPTTEPAAPVTAPANTSTSTSVPVRRLELAPGDPVAIDGQIPVEDWMRGQPGPFSGGSVWLVRQPILSTELPTAGYLGEVTLYSDGRVQLRGTVPLVLAKRTLKFSAALAEPTARGQYTLESNLGEVVLVHITKDAPPFDPPISHPPPLAAEQMVLGDRDLAGVPFGTRHDDAEALLSARFGAPSGRRSWQELCGGHYYRSLSWGALTATFESDSAEAEMHFESYSYRADSDSPPEVSGLGTMHHVRIGTTIEELRGVTDLAEFRGGYEVFEAKHWVVPSGGIVATLDRDFLVPGARVLYVSAPWEIVLRAC
jgi:hypothetical protein